MNELPPAPWAHGFVYLLETDCVWQKIGFSRKPQQRLRDFAHLPFEVRLGHVFAAGPLIERVIHRALAAHLVRGEWFSLPAELIARFKTIKSCRLVRDLPPEFVPPSVEAIECVDDSGPTILCSTIGEAIKAARVAKGYSQGYLAKLCGVSRPTIMKAELGRGEAHRRTVQRLALALGIAVDAKPAAPA